MNRTQGRILSALLLSGLLMALAWGAAAQQGTLTQTTAAVNLRSGPGVEWAVVEVLAPGTPLALDGQAFQGEWVRGISPSGSIGWAYIQGVAISQEAAAALRVVYVDDPFNLAAPAPVDGGGGSTEAATFSATTLVNLRSGPGTDWRVLGQLEAGQSLNADGRNFNSLWVRGITADGTIGWVFAQYLSGPAVASLPEVDVDTPFGAAAPVGGGGGNTGGGNTGGDSAQPSPTPDTTGPIVNSAPVSGFSYGGHVQTLGDRAFNAMRTAGMTWVKKQVRYFPGADPGGAAGIINTAHANGFRVLLGIVGQADQVSNPGYYEGYAAYVAGVAALGADAIEVWNEPNIDREWTPGQVNPAAYTELLRQAYVAIKGANPNTLVISGAPAPTGFFGGCSGAGCDDDAYLAGMAAAGAANYMDCVGVHYNEGIVPPDWTSGDPRGNSGHYTRYFRPMMDVYYNAFSGARPLCFTEMGYLSPEGYGPLSPGFAWAQDVSVAEQAAWLDQAVSMAGSSGRVRLLIVWNVDFTNYDTDPMAGFAMIRPGGACPACEALGR